MEVILAKSAGFCFGVKRAVDTVYEQTGTRGKIYTYGPIIHNEEVVKDMEAHGGAEGCESARKRDITECTDGRNGCDPFPRCRTQDQ